ncbi:DNRLRE domain-containing protein [Nocardioides sp. MH1]|uniref:DNRLRE domain-containing protein n=1 Tax=Nocardioides sp. MH1 TaxID=3242490 RepID=UPI003521836D
MAWNPRAADHRNMFVAALCTTALAAGGLAVGPGEVSPAGAVPLPQNAADDPEPVAELATATSNTYRQPDGSYEYVGYATPINYLDSDGTWQPIDNQLVSSPAAAYAVENAENDYVVKIPEDAGSHPVKIVTAGQWLSFSMAGLDGSPEVDGTEATFTEAPLGVNEVTYDSRPDGVKESIVLNAPPSAAPTYIYGLAVSAGLEPRIRPSGEIEIVDAATDKTVFELPAPFMTDADNVTSNDVTYDLSANGSEWTLLVRPSLAWLQSDDRAYPVVVDPTVVKNPTTDAWITEASPTQVNAGGAYLKVGGGSGDRSRSLLRFDISSIPANAVVQSSDGSQPALLQMYLDASLSEGTGTTTLVAARVSRLEPWTPGALNWANRGSGTPWTSAGGDYGEMSPALTVNLGIANYKNFNVLETVQNWVNKPAWYDNNGFIVMQQPDSTKKLWFHSLNTTTGYPPKLVVKYQMPPNKPTNLTISPVDSTQKVSDSAPTLSAKVTDPDGGALHAQFSILDNTGTQVWTASGSTVTSGSLSTAHVPDGVISADNSYNLQAIAVDDALSSKASASLAFDTIGGSIAVAGLTVGPDGWITYNDDSVQTDLNLTPGTITTLNGTGSTDGCSFDEESDLENDGPAIFVEVGYNPVTCQERVQMTPLTQAATDELEAQDASAESAGSSTESGPSFYYAGNADAPVSEPDVNAPSLAASSYPNHAWVKARWIDPVNITITSLKESMNWEYGYNPTGTFSSVSHAWKYSLDVTHTGPADWHNFGHDANHVWDSVKRSYWNSSFATIIVGALGPAGWAACGFWTSPRADFSHNLTLKGDSWGGADAYIHSRKHGACTNLVHHKVNTSWD